MDEVCELVITAPDESWLPEFTRSLVDQRLAACGHLQPIRSIHRWAGRVEDERETRVALHTRLSLVDRIVNEANDRHPYEVPCVIAIPIVGGNAAYVRWILDQTDSFAAGEGGAREDFLYSFKRLDHPVAILRPSCRARIPLRAGRSAFRSGVERTSRGRIDSRVAANDASESARSLVD